MNSWKFGIDDTFIFRQGIPCVGFGPGNERFAHTAEDHIRIEDIFKATEVYRQLPYHFKRKSAP